MRMNWLKEMIQTHKICFTPHLNISFYQDTKPQIASSNLFLPHYRYIYQQFLPLSTKKVNNFHLYTIQIFKINF